MTHASISFVCLHKAVYQCVLWGGDLTTEWIHMLPHPTKQGVNFWELWSTRTYKTLVQRRKPCYSKFFFFFFGCAAELAKIPFPQSGVELGPSSEHFWALTTGPPRSASATVFWYVKKPGTWPTGEHYLQDLLLVQKSFILTASIQFSSISLTSVEIPPGILQGAVGPVFHWYTILFILLCHQGYLSGKLGEAAGLISHMTLASVVFCK